MCPFYLPGLALPPTLLPGLLRMQFEQLMTIRMFYLIRKKNTILKYKASSLVYGDVISFWCFHVCYLKEPIIIYAMLSVLSSKVLGGRRG